VFIASGGQDFHIVKNAPVPTGGTLQVVSNQKIILESGEVLKVKSSAASSADVIASILEDV
jgi:hypothetical protein